MPRGLPGTASGAKVLPVAASKAKLPGLFHAGQGRHRFTYWLYAHGGDRKQALAVERGYEFNYELAAFQVQPHTAHWRLGIRT